MESTPIIVIYVPLILAVVSTLGFLVTIGALIFGRVFRLGGIFAEFTALRETVASNKTDVEKAIADSRSEFQTTIANTQSELEASIASIADTRSTLEASIAENKAEIAELRQEVHEGFARLESKMEASLQELRGYFVAHLEHHASYPADDD